MNTRLEAEPARLACENPPAPRTHPESAGQVLCRPQWNLASGKLAGLELMWHGTQALDPEQPTATLHALLEMALRPLAAQLAATPGYLRVCLPLEWLERAWTGSAEAWLSGLAGWGLPGAALSVLVPENRTTTGAATLPATLSHLQGAGVEVILSGFGAGTSSLTALRAFSPDTVRLDRSVVPDIAAGSHHPSLTRSLIQLAHGLHLRVMADAVDNDEQLRLLVEHGCDMAQGACFGEWKAVQDVPALLLAQVALPRNTLLPRPRRRTLLLVDDEESILSSLKRVFRRDNYRILTATGGAMALELLASEPVDVIVSDQRMPGMTGIEFLREAKRLYPDTVRITLSGYTDLETIIQAVNEGSVYKFLTKPWEDDLLREHVAKAFEHGELSAENCRLGSAVHQANRDLALANQRLERMVQDESARRVAMQGAAGASRDALDVLPMAVFGLAEDGMLAYVNHSAVCQWPLWASALGSDPLPSMQQLLADPAHGVAGASASGSHTTIEGRRARVWFRQLSGHRQALGKLMLVQLLPDATETAPGRDGHDR